MNNVTNIWHLFDWLRSYIFYGGLIPCIFMIITVMYIKGAFRHKAIKREMETDGFSVKKISYSTTTGVFNFFNRVFDVLIGKTLAFIHKKAWSSVFSIVDDLLPDEKIEKLIIKTGADLSFEKRIKLAQQEFSVENNAFWWNRMRAPDFRNISPILQGGRWFNGEQVEKYLSFLISPKTIYACLKSGFIVAFISFAILAVFNKPQVYFGWQGEANKSNLAKDIAKKIIADPTIIPEFRKDVWSVEEQKEITTKAFEVAEPYALSIVNESKGYNYSFIGFIFKNGILGDLFLALCIGLCFARRMYYHSYELLKIPFIKDSHELFLHNKKETEINDWKRAISAANLRATNYDRNSPLISAYRSTGSQELKGRIGAVRKGDPLYQSHLDKSQNTALFGGTGEGKTRSAIIPEAQAWFLLKNFYLKFERRYNEIFDIDTNRLTPKAKLEGYLQEYRPLPANPAVIAMTIMDIKSQLWKDLEPFVASVHLQDHFIKIGALEEQGQFSLDLLADIDPRKVRAMFVSVASQMGSESKKDFWEGSALDNIEKLMDVVFLFARTKAGMQYAIKNNIKIWSIMFIANLVMNDPKSELLAYAIHSIYVESNLETGNPERFSDILTSERVKSIEYMLTKWQTMPHETKGGIEANMNFIMAGYKNEALGPFMSGVGNNVISISELWKYIVAFDLPMDKYAASGKMILLMAKTLLMEEAVKRQMRFSARVIEISDIFKTAYPKQLVLESSVEMLEPYMFDTSEAVDIYDNYLELCEIIIAQLSKDAEGVKVYWEKGSYETELKKVANALPLIPEPAEYKLPMTADMVKKAKEALAYADKVRKLEPRLSEKLVGLTGIDPSIFKADFNDTPEKAARKEEHLELYYEYQDLKTRISREHMLFMGDEYQELITLDKTGGCYSDYNFPNISRSTNFKMFVATQTVNAYNLKIGDDATKNFLNQMRTQIFLTTEDQPSRDYIVKLAGNADFFEHPEKNLPLKNNGKETGYFLYANINSYISNYVEINKELKALGNSIPGNSPYPYTYDVFAKGEAIDVNFQDFKFDKVFSNIYDMKAEFNIPSLKNHFLDESGVPTYEKTGTASQGRKTNVEQIRTALKQAKSSREEKYSSYIEKGIKKDSPLLNDKEFISQGTIHAFVSMKRAGMTIQDHVIIANQGDYMEREDDLLAA